MIKDYIKSLHEGLEQADSARIALEASLKISARPTASEVEEVKEAGAFANILCVKLSDIEQAMRKVQLPETKD